MSEPGPEAVALKRRRVRARWLGGYRVELDLRDGRFTLLSDESVADGGEDAGPMPSELLFSSVASCFAMAVAWAAHKLHGELPDLEISVSAVADRGDRRYGRVDIEASSTLTESDPERFARIVHLAEQVCWITRTIEPGIPITVRAAGVSTGLPAGPAQSALSDSSSQVRQDT